ncbi:MAG: hypothetical protein PVI90_09245 [Desulfobacteraceae bacterium]|jgi:hypothetical protein
MPALELVSGYTTAPGTTLTEVTICTGNSKTIRAAAADANIRLLSAWTKFQAAGYLQLNSPKLHDNIAAIKLASGIGIPNPELPMGPSQKLYPQDTLSIKIAGSATAGDIENCSLLVYYDDLPGSNGNFITADEAAERCINIKTVVNSLTMGTSGDYSGEELLRADEDLLKANTDYALLGMVTRTKMCSVRYRGTDLGNLGVGIPAYDARQDMTSEWFLRLSRATGLACVPVINSANAGSIYIDGLNDENALTFVCSTILAELAA